MAASKSPRRWFRFSLGWAFFVLSVGCVVLGAMVNRAQRQARAVAMVEQLGGRVLYEHETKSDGNWPPRDLPPPGPAWLRERIGIDYFDHLVDVNLGIERERLPESRTADEHLADLRHLPRLRELGLVNARISDEACRHLATLQALEVLYLSGTHVTDAGLVRIARLRKLQDLRLEYCNITSDGIASLSALPELTFLHLGGTQVDDVGAETLARYPRLRSIVLDQTTVSDRGLKALARLPLYLLRLDQTDVTAAGLAHLREHPTLEALCVSDTVVGDEGARHMATVPNLTDLRIEHARLTEAGVEELAHCKRLRQLHISRNGLWPGVIARLNKALPNCRVVAD